MGGGRPLSLAPAGLRPVTARLLLLIVGLGLALRLLHGWLLSDTAYPRLPLRFTESDMHAFWQWAQRIVAGDWLGRDTYHPYFHWMQEMAPRETWHRWWGGKEIFHQAPLYPYLVAVALILTGGSAIGVLLFQLVVGALQPLVLFALGRRLAGERAGLAAAALAAVYGPFIFHQGVLLRDWLPPILEPLALVGLLRAEATGRDRDWTLAGAALGLALLTRESVVLLLPAVAVWLLWRPGPGWAGVVRPAGLIAAGLAVALAPLVVRNAVVGAPLLALSNRGGETFVHQNAVDSSALWSGANMARKKAILAAADGSGRAAVIETLRTYEGDVAALAGKLLTKLRGAVDPVEIPSNVSFSYGREVSWVLVVTATYGVVFPLGLGGLLLSAGDWRRHRLLYLYIGFVVGVLLLSLPLARYRLALAAALMPYAGLLLARLGEAVRGRRPVRGAVLAGVVGAAALLQHQVLAVPALRTSPWLTAYGEGAEYLLSARIYREEGRLDRAVAEAERLRDRVAADPRLEALAARVGQIEGDLRVLRASQLVGQGRLPEARQEVEQAELLYAGAREPYVLYNLGVLHVRLGEVARGRAFLNLYLQRVGDGPQAAEARRLLGGDARPDAPGGR